MSTQSQSASPSSPFLFGQFLPLSLLTFSPSSDKYSCSYSPSLAKYHTQLLTLSGDGTGSWTLTRVGTAEVKMGIDREIGLLRERLKEVEQWEKRVKELEVMLGPEGAET